MAPTCVRFLAQRKNCNSFSDVAIWLLTGQRLDKRYTQLEAIGQMADRYFLLVRALSGGRFVPNPRAEGWDVEVVVEGMAFLRLAPSRSCGCSGD